MVIKLKRIVKRHKKWLFILMALAVLGIAIIYVMKMISKPADGVVNEGISQPLPVAPAVFKDFKSQYFTSRFANRYELQVNQNKTASLESWIMLAHQIMGQGPGAKIGVSVTNLPAGGVKEDGAYKQFEAFPAIYTTTTEKHQSQDVVVAERTDTNYEHTALWAHGAYLATFSLTSGQKNDQLVTELNTILDNLIWAQ